MEDRTAEIAAQAASAHPPAGGHAETVPVGDTAEERTEVVTGAGPSPEQPTRPLPTSDPQGVPGTPRFASGSAQVLPPVRPSRSSWGRVTVTDASDSPEHEDLGGYGTVAPPRPLWPWILAGVLALAILATGGVVAYLKLRTPEATPAQAVRDYLGALTSGDTESAMTYVEDAGTYTASKYPLLTPAALVRPASRPDRVSVADTSATTVGNGRSATAVSVSYIAGGITVHQTMIVVAAGAGTGTADTGANTTGRPFLLQAPFVTLTVGAAGRAVTVNGVAWPAAETRTFAFPGTYTASVAGTPLVATATASAAYDDSAPTAVRADLTLPPPAPADGAGAAVQAAVNAALNACAASTSAAPGNCPFRYHDDSARMKWSIVTYPTIRVQVGADGTVTFDDAGALASVHYEATTHGFLGFSSTDRGDLSANVTGTATAATGTGGVTVAFNPS
jgi:hypothetical protein